MEKHLIREGNAYMKFFSVFFGPLRQVMRGRHGAPSMTKLVIAKTEIKDSQMKPMAVFVCL
ncbi:hypothetical protein [Myxococcus xanthus]|uniref:hypothetical protein n=1 Tax=Myxococcus xanthus TaxID=34 RepID=UPI00148B6FA8|nr:hypothetical protein [Myxococcus xanthus]NOJ90294.1 hypothetical protein [Myxococcus xanthus]